MDHVVFDGAERDQRDQDRIHAVPAIFSNVQFQKFQFRGFDPSCVGVHSMAHNYCIHWCMGGNHCSFQNFKMICVIILFSSIRSCYFLLQWRQVRFWKGEEGMLVEQEARPVDERPGGA